MVWWFSLLGQVGGESKEQYAIPDSDLSNGSPILSTYSATSAVRLTATAEFYTDVPSPTPSPTLTSTVWPTVYLSPTASLTPDYAQTELATLYALQTALPSSTPTAIPPQAGFYADPDAMIWIPQPTVVIQQFVVVTATLQP